MNSALAGIERELAHLRATQADLSDTGSEKRRQAAMVRRIEFEARLKRSLEYIEEVKENAARLQARLTSLRAAGAANADDGSRFAHECRWLAQEAAKTIVQLEALVARAKREADFAKPRIAWCHYVERGMSEVAAHAAVAAEDQETTK